ncbi:MAG: HPP family-domain-containing protein [Linnemannia elongata]|nr:MAG: HPP family-domain-containing protein [Linnemannia elongata]
MSSFIGVSLYKLFNLMSAELFNRLHWLLCSLSVAISLFVMQLTHTVHPPASASALIAVSGGQAIYDLGYWYLLCPIALGVGLMMIVAMLVNNVVRTYPSHWYAPKSRIVQVLDQDMGTTIADYVNPEYDEDEQEEEEGQKQKAVGDGVASSPAGNDNNKSLTHQPTISSSSSLTFSPTAKETSSSLIVADNHTSADHPTTITPSSPRPVSSTHSHPHSHPQSHPPAVHYAIFYGGDRKEELKDGEKLLERGSGSSSPTPPGQDLEHGHGPHGPTNRRHSILIGLRGSHPSSPPASSGAATNSHVAATEEEYRATIEQLHQRIQDLEARLAAAPAADSNTGSN